MVKKPCQCLLCDGGFFKNMVLKEAISMSNKKNKSGQLIQFLRASNVNDAQFAY